MTERDNKGLSRFDQILSSISSFNFLDRGSRSLLSLLHHQSSDLPTPLVRAVPTTRCFLGLISPQTLPIPGSLTLPCPLEFNLQKGEKPTTPVSASQSRPPAAPGSSAPRQRGAPPRAGRSVQGEGLPGEAQSPWASHFRPGEGGPTPRPPASQPALGSHPHLHRTR